MFVRGARAKLKWKGVGWVENLGIFCPLFAYELTIPSFFHFFPSKLYKIQLVVIDNDTTATTAMAREHLLSMALLARLYRNKL